MNRQERNLLAENIRHYLCGLITNHEFIERTEHLIGSKDKAVVEVWWSFWHTYDDMCQHYHAGQFKLNDEDMQTVKRYILFLKSDYVYEWKDFKYAHNPIRMIMNLLTWGKYPKKWDDMTLAEGDREVWPFFRCVDFQQTLMNPIYLNNG